MNDVVELVLPFTHLLTVYAVSAAVGLLKISRMRNDFTRSGQLSMSRLKISLIKNAIIY